jgi:hypothetical protein
MILFKFGGVMALSITVWFEVITACKYFNSEICTPTNCLKYKDRCKAKRYSQTSGSSVRYG